MTGRAVPPRQTQQRHAGMTDARMESAMGRLLQVGVLCAASIVLLGGVMYILHHGAERVAYVTFQPRPLDLRHPSALLRQVRQSGSRGLLECGILILLATPICRVVFALASFALQRDRLYIVVSAIVLGALLFGLLDGG